MNEPNYTFWNKVSFLIGNAKYKSYSYRFEKKWILDNIIPVDRPLLLKQAHPCKKCSNQEPQVISVYSHQVSDRSHDVCFYCCTDDIESKEFNYHYEKIKFVFNVMNWY